MARETGRVVTRQQAIALLAVLGIDEDEMTSVVRVEVDPYSVQITRHIREPNGILMGADGRVAEHVEVRPIDWRERP